MHPLLGGAGGASAQERNVVFRDEASTMLNRIQNDAVSDTTGDDSSDSDNHTIHISILKN
jgi:hypothetical protein